MSGFLPTDVPSIVEAYGSGESYTIIRQPSLSPKLNETNVRGWVDELEAYKQAVYKLLSTERYDYIIYSWDYGVELKDLIGKHIAYVVPMLEVRLTEAVMQDDRTISVGNFEFDTSVRGVVSVTFECVCIFGETEIKLNVEI